MKLILPSLRGGFHRGLRSDERKLRRKSEFVWKSVDICEVSGLQRVWYRSYRSNNRARGSFSLVLRKGKRDWKSLPHLSTLVDASSTFSTQFNVDEGRCDSRGCSSPRDVFLRATKSATLFIPLMMKALPVFFHRSLNGFSSLLTKTKSDARRLEMGLIRKTIENT